MNTPFPPSFTAQKSKNAHKHHGVHRHTLVPQAAIDHAAPPIHPITTKIDLTTDGEADIDILQYHVQRTGT